MIRPCSFSYHKVIVSRRLIVICFMIPSKHSSEAVFALSRMSLRGIFSWESHLYTIFHFVFAIYCLSPIYSPPSLPPINRVWQSFENLIQSKQNPIHSYYVIKDIVGLHFLVLFLLVLLVSSELLGEPSNYTQVNAFSTSLHIKPEYYFLVTYTFLWNVNQLSILWQDVKNS